MSMTKDPGKFVEKYISAHWGSFIETVIQDLDKSLQVYLKNQDSERDMYGRRKLIAPAENFPSSLAVMNSAIALESFTNAQAFYKKLKTFDTFSELALKVEVLGVTNPGKVTAVRELSVARDAVIHGHLWLKHRTSSKETFELEKVRSYLWGPFKPGLTKLNSKYARNVNWKLRVTNQLQINIIPLDLSYVDGVKALKILIKITEELFTLAKTSWRPPIFPHHQDGFSEATIKKMSKNYHPEDWLTYFEDQLSEIDRKFYDKYFNNF